jgi:hypothetical protein
LAEIRFGRIYLRGRLKDIDLARALTIEGVVEVEESVVDRFLPTILKNKEDMAMMRKKGQEKWLGVI